MVGFSTHTVSKKRFLKENQASTHTYFPGIFSVSFCNVFSFFYFYFLFIYFFVFYLYFLFIFSIYISIFYFYLYLYFYFLFLFSISIFYFLFLFSISFFYFYVMYCIFYFFFYVLYVLFIYICTVCSISISMFYVLCSMLSMTMQGWRGWTPSPSTTTLWRSWDRAGSKAGQPAVYPSIKTFEKSAKNVIVCFLPINQNFPNIR